MFNRKYNIDEGQAISAKGLGSFCFLIAVNEFVLTIKSYVSSHQFADLFSSQNNFVSEAMLIFNSAFISRYVFYIEIYTFVSRLICGFYVLVRSIMITFLHMVLRPSVDFIIQILAILYCCYLMQQC